MNSKLNIRYVCVSKDGKWDDTAFRHYILQIGLSGEPDRVWQHIFMAKCRRETFILKNRLDIKENEIVVHVDKGEEIQLHINMIKSVIGDTNAAVGKYLNKSKNDVFASV